jgi:signal transduction histidine kinase
MGIAVQLDMQAFGDVKLMPEVEITLFRIVQEATVNIARHARAQHVFASMRTDERAVSLSIEDDGEGFDTATAFENTMTGRGLGIIGMKERASLLNGRLTVCSAPGAGTLVFCSIPFLTEA